MCVNSKETKMSTEIHLSIHHVINMLTCQHTGAGSFILIRQKDKRAVPSLKREREATQL